MSEAPQLSAEPRLIDHLIELRSRLLRAVVGLFVVLLALRGLASAAAVRGFLDDYYATSEAWSVRRAAQRVLQATNSWLHAQNQQSW